MDLSNSILQICRRCEANQQGCTTRRIFKITHILFSNHVTRRSKCFFYFFWSLPRINWYHVRLINQNKRGRGAEGQGAEGGMQLIHLFVNEWELTSFLCPPPPCLPNRYYGCSNRHDITASADANTQAVQSSQFAWDSSVSLKVLMALTLCKQWALMKFLDSLASIWHLPCDLFATPRLEFPQVSGFSVVSAAPNQFMLRL